MVKAKIVYYRKAEVVKEWRGNYSCSSLYSNLGAKKIFLEHTKLLIDNNFEFECDCIELYKRNKSGVSRRLVAKVVKPECRKNKGCEKDEQS